MKNLGYQTQIFTSYIARILKVAVYYMFHLLMFIAARFAVKSGGTYTFKPVVWKSW